MCFYVCPCVLHKHKALDVVLFNLYFSLKDVRDAQYINVSAKSITVYIFVRSQQKLL